MAEENDGNGGGQESSGGFEIFEHCSTGKKFKDVSGLENRLRRQSRAILSRTILSIDLRYVTSASGEFENGECLWRILKVSVRRPLAHSTFMCHVLQQCRCHMVWLDKPWQASVVFHVVFFWYAILNKPESLAGSRLPVACWCKSWVVKINLV